jgi:hypothetical protein
MPAHLIEVVAARQALVALGELADDLVGRMPPTSGHGVVLLAPSWGIGLAQHMDHYEGVTSPPSRLRSDWTTVDPK